MAIVAKPTTPDPAAVPEAPPTEGVSGKTAAPLTRDEIAGIVRETATAVGESMRAVVQSALRPAAAPPPAEPPITDVTDDEINAAIASGESPAKLVRRVAEAAAARSTRALRDSEVAPFRATGTAAVAKLVERQAIALMPKYEKFKPQIDAAIEALRKNAPEAALDIDNLLHIHDLVVGRNWKALEAEIREESLRKPAKDDAALDTPRTTARRRPAEKPSTLEDILPDTAISALDDLGAKGRGGRPVGKSFEEFVESLPPYETRDEQGRRVRKRWTPDEYMAELARGGVETEGEA